MVRYATIAFRDIGRLLDQVFGMRYQPQNNFTVVQKQKILDYLFTRSVTQGLQLQNNPPKRQFREASKPQGLKTKQQLNTEKKNLDESSDRLDGLRYLQNYLRCYYVN